MHNTFGLALVGTQAVFLTALIRRIRTSGSIAGISLAGELLWAAAGVGWIAYAYATGSLTVIISGALAAFGSGLIAALTWVDTDTQHVRRAAGLTVAVCAGGVAATVLGGVGGLSVALSTFGVVQFLPHLSATRNTWTTRQPATGVSVVGTLTRCVYATGWALWALSSTPIMWPLAAWGIAGAVAFGTQAWITQLSRSWETHPRVVNSSTAA